MRVLVLIILLNSPLFCQTIENGWKGIKPLGTSKRTVEKLFGKAEIDDNGYYRYRFGDTFVRVNYSTAPCTDNPYERGRFNVPEDTVLDYYVVPKELSLLSQLKFNREKYYKDVSGDTNSILLINDDDGVIIGIQEQEGIEYLAGLDFMASKSLTEKFKCKEIEVVD